MKDWNQLKIDCCPICMYRLRRIEDLNPLYPNVKAIRWRCENPECSFQVGETKKRSIVENLASPRLSMMGTYRDDLAGEEENLAALNNF